MTVHTGDRTYKNAYLLQNTTLLLALPVLHPSSAWSELRGGIPCRGDRDRAAQWEPHPQPVARAPGGLSPAPGRSGGCLAPYRC